jgi:hypothetical protein
MSDQAARRHALNALKAQYPSLTDCTVQTLVDNFFGAGLAFVTAKEGRKNVSKIVCLEEDRARVFSGCEEMAQALSRDPVRTARDGRGAETGKAYMGLLTTLANHLRNLRDWQLVLALVVIAMFGGLAVLIVAGPLLPVESTAGLGYTTAFVICGLVAIGVYAGCYLFDSFLKYRTKSERVRKEVLRELANSIGLGEDQEQQLNFLIATFRLLESKTREKIDTYHEEVKRRGPAPALDLSPLHGYMQDQFHLQVPCRGGLISRWSFDDERDIDEDLQLILKLLRRLPIKASRL